MTSPAPLPRRAEALAAASQLTEGIDLRELDPPERGAAVVGLARLAFAVGSIGEDGGGQVSDLTVTEE